MKLLIQPDDGVAPLLKAVARAKRRIVVVVFRFDFPELERALEAAVGRGVQVQALIAHTNHAGEKLLRKLELRLLKAGVTVSRTADDLARYHGKLMVVDDTWAYVLCYNFSRIDILRNRSFGVAVKDRKLVTGALDLFEADSTRQAYTPGTANLVVSPLNSRERLSTFITAARKELLIYDLKITDRSMIRLLRERADAGVDVRILGHLGSRGLGLKVASLDDLRLHCRAMLRDGHELFVGSQSLRQSELDERREIGVVVRDRRAAKRWRQTFEKDWASTPVGREEAAASEAAADEGEAAAAAG